MDTIVRDPFFHHIPKFFNLSFPSLLEQKHPTAWVEFECGEITEEKLHGKFFNDGRSFDMQGLKLTIRAAYDWVDGMEPVLAALQDKGYHMHAFTNYPPWYIMIEEKLSLSRYLKWTFVSCHMGVRKPSLEAYVAAVAALGVAAEQCVFIDDREVNVRAAEAAGMTGVHFKSADLLRIQLSDILKEDDL